MGRPTEFGGDVHLNGNDIKDIGEIDGDSFWTIADSDVDDDSDSQLNLTISPRKHNIGVEYKLIVEWELKEDFDGPNLWILLDAGYGPNANVLCTSEEGFTTNPSSSDHDVLLAEISDYMQDRPQRGKWNFDYHPFGGLYGNANVTNSLNNMVLFRANWSSSSVEGDIEIRSVDSEEENPLNATGKVELLRRDLN